MSTRQRHGLATLVIACNLLASCQFLRPDAPRVECQGVPPEQCAEYAGRWPEGSTTGGEEVVGVVVTCVSSSCTAGAGEVQVSVRLRSGEVRQVGGGGWSGARGNPPESAQALPEGVSIGCVDVPRSVCDEQASNAIQGLSAESGPIIGITVRCLADVCTERKGEGETRIMLRGSPSVVVNWAYESL
jgi:hypothetical protein